MTSEAEAWADELSELGGDPADWLRRMKEARADPHLRAAHAAQMAMVERAITEGLAERLGTDLDRDPYPGLLAAMAAGVFRSSISFWAGLLAARCRSASSSTWRSGRWPTACPSAANYVTLRGT